jgi:hypothetical protein
MSILLAFLYIPAVQVERGGIWRILWPVAVLVLIIDVICNYTELALLTLDFPRKGEYTFSTRLLRLRQDAGWRGDFAVKVIAYLDYFDPTGRHIK